MDYHFPTINRLIEELRGQFESMGINANPDQSIELDQTHTTLDELENYNVPNLQKVFDA